MALRDFSLRSLNTIYNLQCTDDVFSSNKSQFTIFPQTLRIIHSPKKKCVPKFSSNRPKKKKKTQTESLPYLLYGDLRGVARRKRDKGIAPIGAGHRVHHQPQIPYRAALFEERDQLVFVQVLWNFAAEHLASGSGRATVPAWRRTSVFSLS